MRLSRQDVRLAVRTLGKHPGFATIAILSLALAIALNTTMYSVLDALVNPRVDMRLPDRLYRLKYYGNFRKQLSTTTIEQTLLTGLHGYEAITGTTGYGRGMTVEHGARFRENASIEVVRPNYFAVLGVRALKGRVFGP